MPGAQMGAMSLGDIFGKLGGFFSTNVNPLALKAIDWKSRPFWQAR